MTLDEREIYDLKTSAPERDEPKASTTMTDRRLRKPPPATDEETRPHPQPPVLGCMDCEANTRDYVVVNDRRGKVLGVRCKLCDEAQRASAAEIL